MTQQLSVSSLRTLAESSQYVLGHSYEHVCVIERRSGAPHLAGDHYGDPTCGLIGLDETWFVAGGEGLTLFTFRDGIVEFLRGPNEDDAYFVKGMRLEAEGTVRVLVDPWSDKASVWRLFPDEARVEKLRDGPDLRFKPWRADVEY
jgi:hypothetical protein